MEDMGKAFNLLTELITNARKMLSKTKNSACPSNDVAKIR